MHTCSWSRRALWWLVPVAVMSFSFQTGRAQTATPEEERVAAFKPGIRLESAFPTGQQRFRTFLSESFGIRSSLESAVLAGVNHFNNSPPEWGQGAGGYGRRLAGQFGRSVVKHGIEYGLGAVLHQDPTYRRCECTGFLRRLGHAVTADFFARRPDGSRTFTIIKLASSYGGGMIPMAWYPNRYSAAGDGFRLGTMSFAFSTGTNIIREFWPQIRTLFNR